MKIIGTKICCVKSIAEVKKIVSFNVDWIGFVGPMPGGPGILPIAEIARIVEEANFENSNPVLLTYQTDPMQIIRELKKTNISSVQLVQEIGYKSASIIKENIEDVELIQVVHVQDKTSIEKAIEVSEYSHRILLDSSKVAKQQFGGTGETHDWNLSAEIVKKTPKDVILAGGLNYRNVAEAILHVNPAGVDVCTGVRTKEAIDLSKLSKLVDAIQSV